MACAGGWESRSQLLTGAVLLALLVFLCGRGRADGVSASASEDSVGVVIPLPPSGGTPPLNYILVSRPRHGTVGLADATAAYTPAPHFRGADSFDYVVADATGNYGPPVTVSIGVNPVGTTAMRPPSVTIASNRLVGADGRPFLVKGLIVRPVIAPFYMDFDAFEHFGEDELAAARAWGANTIRLLASQPALDPGNPLHSEQYVASVANAAQQVLDHGFLLIFGVNDEPGNGETAHHCLPTAATQRAWEALLKLPFAAPRYRRHVLLEPFNEPVSEGRQRRPPAAYWWQIWQNGGEVGGYLAGDSAPCIGGRKVGMNQLIAQLRAAGIGNVLIADGLGWAHFLDPRFPLTDPLGQLAYGAHPFLRHWPDFHLVGDPALDYPVLDAAFGAMRRRAPVIATAVDGGAASGSGDFCERRAPEIMPVLLDYLRRHNMGAVGWVFDLPPHSLTLDWNWTPTSYDGFRCPASIGRPGHGGPGQILQQWFLQ